MSENKKHLYYTMLVLNQILSMFDEESENYIDIEELDEDDNATEFVHALSCAAAMVYSRLTDRKCNFLEFNHIANQLVFQFGKLSEEVKES